MKVLFGHKNTGELDSLFDLMYEFLFFEFFTFGVIYPIGGQLATYSQLWVVIYANELEMDKLNIKRLCSRMLLVNHR